MLRLACGGQSILVDEPTLDDGRHPAGGEQRRFALFGGGISVEEASGEHPGKHSSALPMCDGAQSQEDLTIVPDELEERSQPFAPDRLDEGGHRGPDIGRNVVAGALDHPADEHLGSQLAERPVVSVQHLPTQTRSLRDSAHRHVGALLRQLRECLLEGAPGAPNPRIFVRTSERTRIALLSHGAYITSVK